MTRVWAFCTVLVAAMATGNMAYAEIVPAWRGQANTTYQAWDFSTAAMTVTPETVSNPYGTPQASVSLGFAASGYWTDYPPIPQSHAGVWDIGRGVEEGWPDLGRIVVTLPVFTHSGGVGTSLDVSVQVIYYQDITEAPDVNITGGTLLSSMDQVVEVIPIWGSWRVYQTSWSIAPLNDELTIEIMGGFMGTMVDQVIVDTQAVPEPATMAFVGLGLAGLLVRRKRR